MRPQPTDQCLCVGTVMGSQSEPDPTGDGMRDFYIQAAQDAGRLILKHGMILFLDEGCGDAVLTSPRVGRRGEGVVMRQLTNRKACAYCQAPRRFPVLRHENSPPLSLSSASPPLLRVVGMSRR